MFLKLTVYRSFPTLVSLILFNLAELDKALSATSLHYSITLIFSTLLNIRSDVLKILLKKVNHYEPFLPSVFALIKRATSYPERGHRH